jgi:hypothetical protein
MSASQIGYAYEAGRGVGISETLNMLRTVAAKVAEQNIPVTVEGLLEVTKSLLDARFDPAHVYVGVSQYIIEYRDNGEDEGRWPYRYYGPPRGGKGLRLTFHQSEEDRRRYLARHRGGR